MKRYGGAGCAVLGLMVVSVVAVWTASPASVDAHCQVPCGIYNDAARITALREDATTVTKAMKNINDLAGAHDAQGMNQLVRWVTTKEDHASHVIERVANYFLAQRVKPVAAGAEGHGAYLEKLARHHAVIVAAMKAKQNADLKYGEALMHAIDGIAGYYPK